MAFSFKYTWSRMCRMSVDEARTRARQEIGKRLDLVLGRAGWQPKQHSVNRSCAGGGNFFFSQTGLTNRIELLDKYLPSDVHSMVREADNICSHNFKLLGHELVSYGPEIDWHLDAVHNKRASLDPWFRVRFLDFDQVGDHKITWELNRHQHLVTL